MTTHTHISLHAYNVSLVRPSASRFSISSALHRLFCYRLQFASDVNEDSTLSFAAKVIMAVPSRLVASSARSAVHFTHIFCQTI